MLSVIKLGGAVITSADGPDGLDQSIAERLAGELATLAGTGLIVVHGTGAVGKPPAIEFGFIEAAALPPSCAAISCAIHHRIRGLNQRLVGVLGEAGVAAIGIDPALYLTEDSGKFRNFEARDLFNRLLDDGIVPVLYGDMVPRGTGGFRVLSSDVIACGLASELEVENLIFLSDVEGVYDASGSAGAAEVLDEISTGDLKRPGLFDDVDKSDVSGGMRAKIVAAMVASRQCQSCWIGSGRAPGILTTFFEQGIVSGTAINGKQ